MRLYIAEKPSLALAIAENLKGPMKKHNGFFETAEANVTWCYGHILRQKNPDEYNQVYKYWRIEDLPIVPRKWELVVNESCKAQFKIISDLVKKAKEIVNAGDPDREGQLLVDEVLEYLNYNGKTLRVLINAIDEKSVKDALKNLKNNEDFKSLRDSAYARTRADWLIGMNLTRAYTLQAKKAGHSNVFNVGRVKTPTLGLVVRREEEIRNFKPIDYANVKAEFLVNKKSKIKASWKAGDNQLGLDSEGRLIDQKALSFLIEKLKMGGTGNVIFCETIPKKELQPLPYSLSALQVAAGKKFGYSPQEVLDVAQKLYEAKLTTYPRSDCDYLPLSQLEDSKTILSNLSKFTDLFSQWVDGANQKICSRAWNDKEITAHHAIIPTTVCANEKNLSEKEKNLYFLIAQAYIAQFYPVHEFNKTEVKIKYASELFSINGRIVTNEGYKSLYKNNKEENDENKEDDEVGLPPMKKGDVLEFIQVFHEWKKTTPPKRFTEATLIAAMKDIYKFVQSEECKNRLKSTKGIGTEATRATIITQLIEGNFMKVVKKYLEPTEAAFIIIKALPEEITLPDETSKWEDGLEAIYKKDKNVTLDSFVEGLATRLPELMNIDKSNFKLNEKLICPDCKKGVLQRRSTKDKKQYFWGCSNYPECKGIRPDVNGKPGEKKEINKNYLCPECEKGYLQKRLSKDKKKHFWGCSNYPECKGIRFDDNGKPAKS